MAKIIGYDKKILKKYKAICPHCGAIIIFDENEVSTQYQYNEYAYSVGKCPGCENKVSFDREKCVYEETPEFYGWPNTSNCIKNCEHCAAKCLYRKVEYKSALNIDK